MERPARSMKCFRTGRPKLVHLPAFTANEWLFLLVAFPKPSRRESQHSHSPRFFFPGSTLTVVENVVTNAASSLIPSSEQVDSVVGVAAAPTFDLSLPTSQKANK